MSMGMGKTGIPYGSHGIPMGMEIRSAMGWEWELRRGSGKNTASTSNSVFVSVVA